MVFGAWPEPHNKGGGSTAVLVLDYTRQEVHFWISLSCAVDCCLVVCTQKNRAIRLLNIRDTGFCGATQHT